MRILSVLLGSAAILLSGSVLGSQDCSKDCVTKVVTDYSGRPPFKRRVETLPAVDVAQAEIVTSEAELVEVKTVSFKGKPPFKRRVELVEQTEVMQVELSSDAESSKKSGKAKTGNSIFKRN